MDSDKPEFIKSTPQAKKRGNPNWRPGVSGNPTGLRPGSRHKATLFTLALIKGEADAIVRSVILAAKAGDPTAQKLCIERLAPPIKTVPVQFKLPELRSANDALTALAAIAAGTSQGEILPDESEALTATVNAFLKAIEIVELEDRLNALEAWRDESAKGAPQGARFDA